MKAFLAAALLAVTFLPACKKDSAPPPPPPSEERNVVISFTQATIPFSQADSASIIMNKQGSATQYFRRFDRVTGKMNLVMDDNLKGSYAAELYVYTTGGNNNHLYQRNVGLTLPMIVDMTIAGPDGTANGSWTRIY